MRMSSYADVKAARGRPISVKYRVPEAPGRTFHTVCLPANVGGVVEGLVKKGGTIESVDGVRPPKGSNGRAHYDDNNEGPYWASEL